MAHACMSAIESRTVSRAQLSHHARERVLARLEEQVEVVPHQAIGATENAKTCPSGRQQKEESFAILVINNDRLFRIAARHHVMAHRRKAVTHSGSLKSPIATPMPGFRPTQDSCRGTARQESLIVRPPCSQRCLDRLDEFMPRSDAILGNLERIEATSFCLNLVHEADCCRP